MVELPLPSTDREVDALVEWMTDTLCLVRKRGDAMADNGSTHLLLVFEFLLPDWGANDSWGMMYGGGGGEGGYYFTRNACDLFGSRR